MLRTVSIKDSPTTGLAREVDVRAFQVDDQEKVIDLITICYSLKDGQRIISNELRPFERKLTASNVRKVNPANGIVVKNVGTEEEPDYQQPDGTSVESPMNQYDFFKAMINNGPVNIPLIIDGVIMQEDLIYNTYDE